PGVVLMRGAHESGRPEENPELIAQARVPVHGRSAIARGGARGLVRGGDGIQHPVHAVHQKSAPLDPARQRVARRAGESLDRSGARVGAVDFLDEILKALAHTALLAWTGSSTAGSRPAPVILNAQQVCGLMLWGSSPEKSTTSQTE